MHKTRFKIFTLLISYIFIGLCLNMSLEGFINQKEFCFNLGQIENEIRTSDNDILRDDLLINNAGLLQIIDVNGTIKKSIQQRNLDKEILPNGHFLICDPGKAPKKYSTLKEYDQNFNLVWYYNDTVDGKLLQWVHDADYLGNDRFLIADTLNDRVIEMHRNGSVMWSWYAVDHYVRDVPEGMSWTHLNDVDRLPDGSTMICLKNFDKIIIVNTTITGDILWEYGEIDNYALLQKPHDPEYTPSGTILIPDSSNHRIIEINKDTKEVIWNYSPSGDHFLGWPRDADILPNGNIQICDTERNSQGKNRIYEINKTTKEVLWYYDTNGNNYDAERIDATLPEPIILSPLNRTYFSNTNLTISLGCTDPWYDSLLFRIHDDTINEWLEDTNTTYIDTIFCTFTNNHSYTFHAWGLDSYIEGGAALSERAINQISHKSIKFKIELSNISLISPKGWYSKNDILFLVKNHSIVLAASFQYKLDSSSIWSNSYSLDWNGTLWTYHKNDLNDGRYSVNFMFEFLDSNYDFINSSFVIDTIPPQIDNLSYSSNELHYSNNITCNIIDNSPCSIKITRELDLTIEKEVIQNWTQFSNYTFISITIDNINIGIVNVSIEIKDYVGNIVLESIQYLCQDNLFPQLRLIDPNEKVYMMDSSTESTYPIRINLQAFDLSDYEIWFRIYNLSNSLFLTNENISYTESIIMYLTAGIYRLDAWAIDEANNINETHFTFEIKFNESINSNEENYSYNSNNFLNEMVFIEILGFGTICVIIFCIYIKKKGV